MKNLHISIIIILIAVSVGINTASAEKSSVILTPFDISFSEKDFTKSGPLHQILILKPNETATITIKVDNRDTVQNEISFSVPYPENISDFVDSYFFEPSTITVQPNSEQQVLLHLKTKEKTETHWGTMSLLAQSKSFGMIGKYFYLVIGDKSKISELDPFIDHSMREDLPGPAFPQVVNDFPAGSSELLQGLDKIMPEDFVAPRYLPSGYSFQGTYLPAPLVGLLYASIKITNTTESIDFWRSGGILIYSESNSPNFNLTSWLPAYSAQNEAKQIMINGMMGVATEQQERVVVDGPKYKFPAEIVLFDKNTEIELRGNVPLDELVRVASSMHQDKSLIHLPGTITKTITLSPLKQFKSGIKAQDVKCNQDLQLVIKSEDGSPACVKLEHLTRLSQYGWTIPNLKIIGDTDITNNEGLSESNCGQFHTIPENKSDSNEIPVLILQQNSIGCAKITFTVLSLFNNTNDCIGCNSQIVKISEMLSIGKYNFSRHGNLLSGSATDYTHSFQITAVPETVDLTNFPVGSNFTAIFMIKPLPNATGFYDYSIVKPVCNAYPLAVGYSSDQVNSSDFSEDLGFMQNHPCHYGPYGYSPVQVSGISYVQMKLN